MTLNLPPAEPNSKSDEGLNVLNTGAHEDIIVDVRWFFNYSELNRGQSWGQQLLAGEKHSHSLFQFAETAKLEEATKSVMLKPSLSCQIGMSSWEL